MSIDCNYFSISSLLVSRLSTHLSSYSPNGCSVTFEPGSFFAVNMVWWSVDRPCSEVSCWEGSYLWCRLCCRGPFSLRRMMIVWICERHRTSPPRTCDSCFWLPWIGPWSNCGRKEKWWLLGEEVGRRYEWFKRYVMCVQWIEWGE